MQNVHEKNKKKTKSKIGRLSDSAAAAAVRRPNGLPHDLMVTQDFQRQSHGLEQAKHEATVVTSFLRIFYVFNVFCVFGKKWTNKKNKPYDKQSILEKLR